MSKKFTAGTDLYMYECMMQQTPSMIRGEKDSKKQKAQYVGMLKQFMREFGYGHLHGKMLKSLNKFLFDEFVFCNEEHRDVFWKMYARWARNSGKKDNKIMAVIYLLSTKKQFLTVLANYISNPRYVLPTIVDKCDDIETYNLYHGAKMILGIESGMIEEDITEDGIIDEKVLCLIINAKLIVQYGISGYRNKKKQEKPQYINYPKGHRRKQKTYNFKGQSIRIK